MQSQVGPQVDSEGKKLGSRFGGALGTAAKIGLVAGAFALVSFGKSAIGAASDAQQSIGATETVFGKFADTVIKTSDGAAQAYGLSANTYRENANLIGSLFKNQGVATDELSGKTQDMIGVGADLAATFGGTTTDAVQTLGAAFKGEYDSIERYGISIKESTVSAELAKRGQENLTGAQLAAAKQAVVTDLIMRQSKDSLGAFGRESNTLAGQQQRLGASFENIKATLGAALLPLLTRLAGYLNATVLPAVVGFIAGIRSGTGAGGQFAAVVKTIAAVLASVVGFVVANIDVLAPLGAGIGVVVAAVKAWRAAQIVLNIVLTANPIGLVIAAIAALVVGVVIAYKKSETFRNIVNTLWAALKVTIGWVTNLVGKLTGALVGAIGNVIGKVQTMVSWVRDKASAAWNTLKDKAISAAQAILTPVQSVIDKVQAMVTLVRDKAVGVWTGLKTAATGAMDAISSAVQWVIDKVQALINAIQSIPGIPGGDMEANGTLVGGVPRVVVPSAPAVPQSFSTGGGSVIAELRALRAAVLVGGPDRFAGAINGAAGNAARSR